MATVTYKHQPGIHKTRGNVGDGNDHVYTVTKVLWPEDVTKTIEEWIIPTCVHVCCGKSPLGDCRVDKYEQEIDIKADAVALPLKDESFTTVLCDPPYNGKFKWNHDLLKELSRVAAKRIIFQHWFIPADPQHQWKKWHKFKMVAAYVWQPRTYFGRAQIISIFDC